MSKKAIEYFEKQLIKAIDATTERFKATTGAEIVGTLMYKANQIMNEECYDAEE